MTDQRIQDLADRITRETTERYRAWQDKFFPNANYDGTRDCTATIKPGAKYTKVDVGSSGKYMVDQDGRIFGTKAYGVIHRGHQYGTLDTIEDWYWGDYVAARKVTKGLHR